MAEWDKFDLTIIADKLPTHLLSNLDLAKTKFEKIAEELVLDKNLPKLLKQGIYFALFQTVLRLVARNTDPTLPEILPEYKRLIEEVSLAYHSLKPNGESNWLDECIQFGDKSAYHWEWKHFDSHELF
ncbi:hypothetical protein P3G55_15900 [Leptospira sp. 96542]|nr:hypothetical protein [Leptospira sp. 96542]